MSVKSHISSLNRRRIAVLGVLAVVLILSVFFSVRSCENDTPVEYVFSKVEKGEVVRTVFVTGKVNFLIAYMIDSELSNATIDKVKVGLNKQVKKGDILATVKSDELQFNLKQAKESLIQANLMLASAKDVFDQKKKLLESKVIAKKEFEEATRNLERAQSTQRSNQNALDKIQKDVDACVIKSPVSGQVVQVMAYPGQIISKGTDLFQIVENMKKMGLELNIDETDIGAIKEGKSLEFTVSAFPDKKFTGKITSIPTTSTTQGNIVTYKALAECDNSSLLLKSGMSATASIFIDKAQNTIKVPNEALTASPVFSKSDPAKRFVWKKVPDDGSNNGMKKTEVKTGLSGNGFTQITAGNVTEKDQVLVQVRKKAKGQAIPGL